MENNLSTPAQFLRMKTKAEKDDHISSAEGIHVTVMWMICICNDENDEDEDVFSVEAKVNPRVWLSCDFSKRCKLFPQWKQFPHVKPQSASQYFQYTTN